MRIVLIGADGQLGTDLHEALREGYELVPLIYPEFDLTHPEQVKEKLREFTPDVIVNTAAYNKVDDCEDNPWDAFRLNTFAVHDLARICKQLECSLVHFSTDYVFDGTKKIPYTEVDTPNPLSVYGVSKLAGEIFVRNTLDEHFLVRTCGLYGIAGCWGKGANFVDAMVSLERAGETIRVVDDQWVTPTSTRELAQHVIELIHSGHYGTYHLTNEGRCTWFQFAQAIFLLLREKPQLHSVATQEYQSRAPRPAFSVLENRNAKRIGLTSFSDWKAALEEYLKLKGYLT